MAAYSIEVPFPADHAPFKIIKTTSEGKRRIVDSAMTRETAEKLLAIYEAKESRQPR